MGEVAAIFERVLEGCEGREQGVWEIKEEVHAGKGGRLGAGRPDNADGEEEGVRARDEGCRGLRYWAGAVTCRQ